MKKMVWIVVGLVVVIGAVVLVGRPEKSGKPEGFERTQEEGGGAQASATEGREASAAPDNESVQSVEDPRDFGVDDKVLSEAVKALLGQDGKKHNYSSLLKAINALDAEMSAMDVAALREMLNFSNDRFPEKMRSIEINAVKNDVLDKLLRQKDLPEGLGLQMVEMAGNTENDPVWRDYCIQFFPMAWEKIDAGKRLTTEYTDYTEKGKGEECRIANKEQGISKGGAGREGEECRIANREQGMSREGTAGESDGGVASTKELAAIRDAMFLALDERDATLAGTALIGLELLSRTHDEFDREVIVGKAVEIASDEMASASSRLTALRLSAGISNDEQGMANVEVVQAARSLAQTGETVLLRSAAIVTLGEVGVPDDRELLESYVASDNRQIADAAKMALAKMDARN